jgi:hypothetical protein
MSYRTVTHIALHVASLDEAEAFSRELFAMDVCLREEISMLSRDAFSLALEPKTDGPVGSDGPLAHVGLQVDDEEIGRLERDAQRLGCGVLRLRPGLLIVRDRYGVLGDRHDLATPAAIVELTKRSLAN